VTALVINQTYRELLLVSVIVLLIPAPLLTKSIQVQVVEPIPSVSIPLRVEHLPSPFTMPSQFEAVPSPVPVVIQQPPKPVLLPKQTFTQAETGIVSYGYGYNPKPKYPNIARSSGWEGKVVLQVRVSTSGKSEQITVSQSSGHEVLDQAAVDAVKEWHFVPAKRGDTAVSGTVSVPINFKLD
jgi:protein TonB